jgi:acetyltransferase-like isoleucine patch superfamily enzyme
MTVTADDLLDRLKALWTRRRREVDERFDRTLPLGEYVVDRWEKARELGFGEGSSIYDSSLVFGDVVVGESVWIGPFTVIDGSGGLTIGDGCNISAGVHLYSHSSVLRCVSGSSFDEIEHKPTAIGSRVFIGANSVVNMGVTIGDEAVVGAGAVVTSDVPPRTVVTGVPARPVATVRIDPAGGRPSFDPID